VSDNAESGWRCQASGGRHGSFAARYLIFWIWQETLERVERSQEEQIYCSMTGQDMCYAHVY
jgi:hypothetical protein